MSDLKCAGMQLEGARRDLVTLEEATPRVPDESFGFHAQQATEKALKAWLALLGRKYPLTHDLDDLFAHLAAAGATTAFFHSLTRFTPYAVQFRYEGLGPDHEPMDRPAAIALTGALIKHVGDLMAKLEHETR